MSDLEERAFEYALRKIGGAPGDEDDRQLIRKACIDFALSERKRVIEEVLKQAKAINGFKVGTMTCFNAVSIDDLEQILTSIEGGK